MSEYGSDHELQEETLSNPDVVTKYKAASKIVNGALAAVIEACKPGAKVVEICEKADSLMNDCVGHYSPLHDNTAELKEGDLVKIDLGCHIDGYIAQAAHSLVVASDPAAPKSGEVAPVLGKIAEAYGCNLVDGVMTYEMTRFVIDAQKAVLQKPSPDMKVDECEFEEGEVYAIDIIVTTGEGKPKVLDEKETTVYKRAMEVQYQLKMKASRELLSEVGKKYPTMLFSLRGVEAKQARFGLVECLNHGLLAAYPVTYEKDGDVVAHIKGTVLLMPSGSDRITSAPLQPLQSDKSVEDEEIKALLATSLKNKKKKKKADKEAAPAQA
ncbi:proliferation-associated 2G4 [Micractinium conductrix]|uniref:Proliferation-associated 2G4 n=1 Tax=Micractinium conductrix TaxID=554055 RepID=A0A2P6UZB9_9CHLO|nr:proliferation-associated 2G4 [Micractinium conductrix]|eukprot:PSC67177.1 proliferation-associated 2G4 [Micractinium conductrix]